MTLYQKIRNLLSNIDLTPSEIECYLIIHKYPGLSIAEITKKAKISLISGYRAFEKLKEYKLITSSKEDYKKSLYALPLKNLANILSNKERNLRKIELELRKIDTLLEIEQKSHTEDPFTIITDKENLKEQAQKILYKPWDNLLCYGSAERLLDVLGEDTEFNFIRTRVKKGKKSSAIITEIGDFTTEFIPKNIDQLRTTKFKIDPKNQNFIYYIYNDELTIWVKDSEIGNKAIISNDPIIVQNYKDMWENMWKMP